MTKTKKYSYEEIKKEILEQHKFAILAGQNESTVGKMLQQLLDACLRHREVVTPDNMHKYHPFIGDGNPTKWQVCDEMNKANIAVLIGDCDFVDSIDAETLP